MQTNVDQTNMDKDKDIGRYTNKYDNWKNDNFQQKIHVVKNCMIHLRMMFIKVEH